MKTKTISGDSWHMKAHQNNLNLSNINIWNKLIEPTLKENSFKTSNTKEHGGKN